jgi:hypothetical protein
MGNDLSIIGDTIKEFLIDDNYILDDTLEWTDQAQIFIMRYRRIIGIFMLIILLFIMRYCNYTVENEHDSGVQIGGSNDSALVSSELAKLRATDTAKEQFAKEKAAAAEAKTKANTFAKVAQGKAAKAAGRSSFSKEMGKAGSWVKGTKIGKGVGKAGSAIGSAGKFVGSKVGAAGSKLAKDSYVGSQVAKLGKGVGAAVSDSKVGQFAKDKMADIGAMKSAGMSKFGIAKELTGQAGQYAADKFKQFAGWLYEILFAIAISIAICMIVVPSISFIILGIICYFLLRKKIATMKGF